jgi:hypothetical protein
MPNRSSSTAQFFGYKLFAEPRIEADEPHAHSWRASVLKPNGQPIIDPLLEAPWISQTEAETRAEFAARAHSHQVRGVTLPTDAEPQWEAN